MKLHRRSTGNSFPAHSVALAAVGAIGVVACVLAVRAAEEPPAERPLSAPVKVLAPRDAPAEQSTPNRRTSQPQQTQPTLPGGKLPQYEMGYRHRVVPDDEELQDPDLRFILALPSRPILLEAAITIDGKPFRMAREDRVQQILKSARQSDRSTDPTSVPEQTQDKGEAAESETASPEKNDGEALQADDGGGDDKGEEENTQDSEPEGDSAAETSAPPYTPATTATERVRRYMAATGRKPSAHEVRWLLTNRIDGPALLMLNDNFQRFRADQRPVFDVLDRDRDGTVSAGELERAVASFNECDLNQNHIVDALEIEQAARDRVAGVDRREPPDSGGRGARRAGSAGASPSRKPGRPTAPAGRGKLLFRIPEAASSASVYRRLASRYASPGNEGGDSDTAATALPRFDTNADGRFDAGELQALHDTEPDVRVAVSFNTDAPEKSAIAVTDVSSAFEESLANAGLRESTVVLPLGETSVEFSAVQSGASDQVSVGAVNDGYPLLPAIDPNDDGRFTIRELRGLLGRLREFDRNRDGRLESGEVRAPIRVCFGLGPLVHRELAGIRTVHPQPDAPAVTGPAWFVRMDRNKDHDLSRDEFPGTDEQFGVLDADGDELISAQEAAEFDKKSASPEDNSTSPERKSPPSSLEEAESGESRAESF